MALSASDTARLGELEASLWQEETRFDREYMEGVLAHDFTEFGRSGRVYARDDTLAVPSQPIEAELSELRVRELADGVVLVTYRTAVRDGNAVLIGNRASVWSRRPDARWVLRFHQGTAVP